MNFRERSERDKGQGQWDNPGTPLGHARNLTVNTKDCEGSKILRNCVKEILHVVPDISGSVGHLGDGWGQARNLPVNTQDVQEF